MIEKIDQSEFDEDTRMRWVLDRLIEKVDELVDAVNKIEEKTDGNGTKNRD